MAGHNKIRMNELTELFIRLGFENTETYIQSGNVIFSDPENLSTDLIASRIENGIRNEFKCEIPVLIRTAEDLHILINGNPFSGERNFDSTKLAVIFLSEFPQESQIEKVSKISYPPDKFIIIGREIYTYCPEGFGRTKIYTNFFEKKMHVTGTARSWKTINAIFEIACSGNKK